MSEFSDENSVMVVKGWDLLTDSASALAFGNAVAAAPRSSTGNTALSNGIRRAAELLLAGNFDGARLVIDVASDHPGDGGQSAHVRERIVEAGITVNALPIMTNNQAGSFDGRTTFASGQWGLGGIVGSTMDQRAANRRLHRTGRHARTARLIGLQIHGGPPSEAWYNNSLQQLGERVSEARVLWRHRTRLCRSVSMSRGLRFIEWGDCRRESRQDRPGNRGLAS